MKVLIMSVTAGGGHNSTAQAILKILENKGIETKYVDTCKEIDPALYHIIADGYLATIQHAKKFFGFGYSVLEHRKKNSYKKSFVRMANGAVKTKIVSIIEEFKPDVIVYTHVFCGCLLDVIKQTIDLNARTIGILTDFTIHPYWEESLRTHCFVVPNDLMIPSVEKKGFLLSQIYPIGIPINPKFAQSISKEEACNKFELDPSKLTLLLMGGSMGYGNLVGIVKELDSIAMEFQIISVCGNNEKSKKEIDELTLSHKIVNFGFTDQISDLMDAADCIISKPGGLTTSEALAKDLPMIIHDPIPGQEDRNTEFLINNGVAVRITKTYPLSVAIYQLLKNPQRIENMKQCIQYIKRPNATQDLANLILEQGKLK